MCVCSLILLQGGEQEAIMAARPRIRGGMELRVCVAGRLSARTLIEFVSGDHVDKLRLQHVTAIALSLWLGFLACVLGCVQPVLASASSTQTAISQLKAAANEGDGDQMAGAGPCCHHSRGASDKKQRATTVS